MKPKAKTKSKRMWAVVNKDGDVTDVWHSHEAARQALWPGAAAVPATLTWTPPKKRAKR